MIANIGVVKSSIPFGIGNKNWIPLGNLHHEVFQIGNINHSRLVVVGCEVHVA